MFLFLITNDLILNDFLLFALLYNNYRILCAKFFKNSAKLIDRISSNISDTRNPVSNPTLLSSKG